MHKGNQKFMKNFCQKTLRIYLFGHRLQDNVKMDLKGSGRDSVDSIHQSPPKNKS
jgi:hypothetical protein